MDISEHRFNVKFQIQYAQDTLRGVLRTLPNIYDGDI